MDTISNYLTIVRNASFAKKANCMTGWSRVKECLAIIWIKEGLIKEFTIICNEKKIKTIILTLKYIKKEPVIQSITRVSKPGCRLYYKSKKIPNFLKGIGIVIVSTPKGIMNRNHARKRNLGGEVICKIW